LATLKESSSSKRLKKDFSLSLLKLLKLRIILSLNIMKNSGSNATICRTLVIPKKKAAAEEAPFAHF